MVLSLDADSGVPNSHAVMLMMRHGNDKGEYAQNQQ
jgi:hypothetical protein